MDAIADIAVGSRSLRKLESQVLKWLFTLVLAVIVIGAFTPWFRRQGVARMPGDVEIKRDGKRYLFPIGSTILLSLLAGFMFWMLR